jgi:hypothetical protein
MKDIGIVVLVILGILWLRNRQASADPGDGPGPATTKFVVGDHVRMRTDLGQPYPDPVTYTVIRVSPDEVLASQPGVVGYYTFYTPGSSGKYSISSADYLFEKVII